MYRIQQYSTYCTVCTGCCTVHSDNLFCTVIWVTVQTLKSFCFLFCTLVLYCTRWKIRGQQAVVELLFIKAVILMGKSLCKVLYGVYMLGTILSSPTFIIRKYCHTRHTTVHYFIVCAVIAYWRSGSCFQTYKFSTSSSQFSELSLNYYCFK